MDDTDGAGQSTLWGTTIYSIRPTKALGTASTSSTIFQPPRHEHVLQVILEIFLHARGPNVQRRLVVLVGRFRKASRTILHPGTV